MCAVNHKHCVLNDSCVVVHGKYLNEKYVLNDKHVNDKLVNRKRSVNDKHTCTYGVYILLY